MIDNDMTNILRNFSSAEKGSGEITDAAGKTKVSTAASEKNAMKALLEGLDAQQSSANQMPAQHKMTKNTATKHPASKYLVGENDEEDTVIDPHWEPQADLDTDAWGDYGDNDDTVNEALRSVKVNFDDGNSITTSMAANLSDEQIRDYYAVGKRFNMGNIDGQERMASVAGIEILEDTVEEGWLVDKVSRAGTGIVKKADAAGIAQLKKALAMASTPEIATNISLMDDKKKENLLSAMQRYLQTNEDPEIAKLYSMSGGNSNVEEDTISKREAPRQQMNKKQSLADLFRSMDETEEDMAGRFKKELHADLQARKLNKGTNGKFDLAEQPVDEAEIISSDSDSTIDHLVGALGAALYTEGVELAKEVYRDEGAGKSGAGSEEEYVRHATSRFLDKEYLRAIMSNIIEAYNNNKV